jgi:hypothetical protein
MPEGARIALARRAEALLDGRRARAASSYRLRASISQRIELVVGKRSQAGALSDVSECTVCLPHVAVLPEA